MADLDKPGPDYVRVLAVLPAEKEREWLRSAARALLHNESWTLAGLDANLPDGFVLDESYCAVSLGPTRSRGFEFPPGATPNPDDWRFEKAKFFTIRGFVKVKTPSDIPETLDDLDLYSDPSSGSSLTCGLDPAVGSIVDVQTRLDVARLTANGLNGAKVAVAMVDSGIFLQHLTGANYFTRNPELTRPKPQFPLTPRTAMEPPVLDEGNSWQGAVATPPGAHRRGHGTMCAYNILAVAPKATLLDFPSLIARAPGDHTVGGTVSAAQQAFGILLNFWINNLVSGSPYNALVVNNSWGIFHPCEEDVPPGHSGRFIDNSAHPFHLYVWLLSAFGADVIFAAGNGGMPCPTPPFLHLTAGSIRGANAYREVLTVAGCDIKCNRVGYSSQGPSTALKPLLPERKPDLTAYTHFLGSQVFGEREPDRGTSTACPIAAGCVAALRTKLPPNATSPAKLFTALKNTASPVGPAGWNPDYGHGIINPVAAGKSLGVIPP